MELLVTDTLYTPMIFLLLKILVVLAFRHKAAQAEKLFNSQNHKIAVHNESHG